MFQAATPTRHRQKVLQVTSMAHGWSPDGTRVVSAARSGHFGCGLFMKSWNDIISLGYHWDIIVDGFGAMTVMTFQHGLFFSLHFAKGIPHHRLHHLKRGIRSYSMDLQPAYCKLERINSERSHCWFPNLWAAGRRTKSGKSGIQVMSISYQAKLLLSAMCILVCVSIGFGHYSNCIILFPHHSPNLRYPGMKNMIGTTAA